jgi:putative ABC transport system permease protein
MGVVRGFNMARIRPLINEMAQELAAFRLGTISHDLRYSIRHMAKNPSFFVTAVLTLALGISASSAVFAVAYGVLIDPFPYKDVHTLATPKLCWPERAECGWRSYSPQQFNEIAEKTDIFAGVTASTVGFVELTGNFEPQRVRGNYITPNTFDVLGVEPILGRATMDTDVDANHEEVALLSFRYWQAHYGGSPSVIGQVINVDRHPRIVIGVMPPRFLWRGADVYLPIKMTNEFAVEGQRRFALVGRLKPGVTDAQAAVELAPIFAQFAQTEPFMYPKNLHLGILPFDQMFKSGLASILYLLLGSVFVLLFISCVNVSSLLLARAVSREREFMVRASIGASRLRLIRHALTESLLLALIAFPVSLICAYAGLRAILRIVPTDTIPDEAVITMNVPVLLASLGFALGTVLIFGTMPAWHSARPRLAAALNSFRSSDSRAQRRLLSGFVVTEIALSLALLMLAGLMVRSLIAVENVPVPFTPDRTLMLRVPLAGTRYPTPESRTLFFKQLLDRTRAVPGVSQATVDSAFPFMDIYADRVQISGEAIDKRVVAIHLTDPVFLLMSGRKMLQGHFLDSREVAAASHEVVITQNFAQRYFAGENSIGRTIQLPEFKPDGKNKIADDAFTVVGVMSDLPFFVGFNENYPNVFLPYTVAPAAADSLIVSTSLPADVLINPMRQTVHSIDKDQPIVETMSLRQMLDMYGYAGPRFSLALFGTFALAALLLSLVGVYGVLSFVTSQRTHEIGIRMALGANRSQVMWLVLRQALILALLGVAIGLPLAFLAGRLAREQLIQTSQFDPLTLFAVASILPLLAVAGTCLPARRAAGVNPVSALRNE